MPFAGKLRELQSALLAVLFVFALSLVGFFFIADSTATLAAAYFDDPSYGRLLIGVVAVTPMAILILVRWIGAFMKKHRKDLQPSAFMGSDDLPDNLRDLIETVQRLTRTAPVAAMIAAVVAGVIIIRHPTTLPLVIALLKEHHPA